MITSAWNRTATRGDGEMWIYPESDEAGAYTVMRLVVEGKALDWVLSPDESGILAAILNKAAEINAKEEPASMPVAPQTDEDVPEPLGEVFVRQEPTEPRPSTFKEKVEQALGKLNP